MLQCEILTRKWGNSIGITIPKEVVEEARIKENQKIRILIISPDRTLKESFGTLKGKLKQSAQELKDEIKKELYNE